MANAQREGFVKQILDAARAKEPYKVLTRGSIASLVTDVNQHLALGYETTGGICIDKNGYYHQALVWRKKRK
jgi:hypothetical protein